MSLIKCQNQPQKSELFLNKANLTKSDTHKSLNNPKSYPETQEHYGTPNTSEVTSIFVDNQKFVLSIRITEVTITIIIDMYKSIKMLLQIYIVTIKRAVTF